MKTSARLLPSLARELVSSTRLRWGLGLILALLLGNAIVVQFDRLDGVRRDHGAAVERLGKARVLLRQPDTPALLDAERDTHRRIRSMFWQAETEGLARAKLQATLAGLFARLGLKDIRFRSGSGNPVPDLPGVWRVQIRLDTRVRPGSELRMVHALATHPRKLIVDRLDLKRHDRNETYVVLVVSSHFIGPKTASPE